MSYFDKFINQLKPKKKEVVHNDYDTVGLKTSLGNTLVFRVDQHLELEYLDFIREYIINNNLQDALHFVKTKGHIMGRGRTKSYEEMVREGNPLGVNPTYSDHEISRRISQVEMNELKKQAVQIIHQNMYGEKNK